MASYAREHPDFGGGRAVQASKLLLSDDPDTAVAQTVAQMAAYVQADRDSPEIRSLARELRGRSAAESIENTWRWIKSHVRFIPDRSIVERLGELGWPVEYSSSRISEVLIRPRDLVRMARPGGDCDDFSMLGASLLRALGFSPAFVTVAADYRAPGEFSHVYVWVDSRSFDASHGSYCGWEVPDRYNKRQLWSTETGMPIAHVGLGFGESTATTSPWWLPDVNSAISTTLDILKARYAVPPSGTVIQTPGGVISRNAVSPTGVGLQFSTPVGSTSIPSWIWIALAVLAALFLFSRRR